MYDDVFICTFSDWLFAVGLATLIFISGISYYCTSGGRTAAVAAGIPALAAHHDGHGPVNGGGGAAAVGADTGSADRDEGVVVDADVPDDEAPLRRDPEDGLRHRPASQEV